MSALPDDVHPHFLVINKAIVQYQFLCGILYPYESFLHIPPQL